jgi:hypothetical protein
MGNPVMHDHALRERSDATVLRRLHAGPEGPDASQGIGPFCFDKNW